MKDAASFLKSNSNNHNEFFSKQKLESIYKKMLLSRFADEKMAKLAKQNKGGTFQLSSAGHEMIGVVCGEMLTSGKDWSLPYYRDQPFALGIGCDLTEILGAFLARATLNHSGGRMMPNHFSHKKLRILCQSSVVGSQFLHAAGKALGIKNLGLDEVVYVSAGEGATSQGDFHEALNFSAIHQLPVIFVIQDNGWAISVAAHEQTAGGSIASVARGYAGLEVFEADGTDYLALTAAMDQALQRGRLSAPSLLIARVPRLAAHSASDDPKKYKTPLMMEEDQARDPLPRFRNFLLQQGFAEKELDSLVERARQEVEESALAADLLPFPEEGTATHNLFAPYEMPQPLSEAPETFSSTAESAEQKIVIMDAINHALDEEMRADPHLLVFGQDVAHGKGGVFGITHRLTEKYGKARCFNTPLAESTIIGIAIGLALDGIHKPVAEIQFADYLWTGINQLFNEAASIYYRSNGEWSVPIVVRVPYGGYIQGGPYHSQSIEGFLTHCPGLKVVVPSNAADAKGLLKSAILDPNPVIFLEHKALYRQQKFCARNEPPSYKYIPLGQASLVRPGTDLTLICWGMMVVMAWEAAEALAAEGISVEVIDLRTLVPLDIMSIFNSVKKTGKVLIAHEAPKNCGFGAEIAARVSEEIFEYLDAPVMRLCGLDTPVPYCKQLENEVLPQTQDLLRALRSLAAY